MKVVIISNNDWNGLWYQRQQFAKMYADRGHKVLFINKTLQRMPRVKDFVDRFFTQKSITKITSNSVPDNIEVKTIYALPPFKYLNFINRILVKKAFTDSAWRNCDLLITYIPTYTALDIIDELKPRRWAYINVHNYNADQVISDLLKSEEDVCANADVLFADSVYNMARLRCISCGRTVFASEPGVDSKRYIQSYRGDESCRASCIGYFGGIGTHLDFDVYNRIAETHRVVFIGNYNTEESVSLLSPKIEVHPPVSNAELPQALREIDVLGLFYKKTDYVNGVIPAKIYECISTLKPIITTGMDNVKILGKAVYTCSAGEVVDIIDNLQITETKEILNLRRKIAAEADWKNRFVELNKNLGINVW